MNSSLTTADNTTHIKIVIIALLAAMVGIWVGIAGRTAPRLSDSPRVEKSTFETQPSVS